MRADAVGLLHLSLRPPTGQIEVGGDARPAQLGDQREGGVAAVVPGDDEDPLPRRSVPVAAPTAPQSERDPVDSESPAAARRRRAAELLDQAVVASAAPIPDWAPRRSQSNSNTVRV